MENQSLPAGNGVQNAKLSIADVQPNGIIMNLPYVQKLPADMKFLTYAKLVSSLGQEIQDKVGINKIVPIIQSAHESRNGNSGLARNHGNLFGITATDSWKKAGNAIANMPTFEFINGNKVEMNREFRAYMSWLDSFYDWARIITELNVYKKAYALMRDSATVTEGIVEMAKVYATDPHYAKSLLELYNQIRIGES